MSVRIELWGRGLEKKIKTTKLTIIAYIFDLQTVISVANIFTIAAIISAIFIAIIVIYLVFSRETLERKLKPSYQREFSTLMIISSFGILGRGIVFTYLGGALFYVPHVIIPLFIFTYILLFIVGEKYFNVNLLRK